MKKISVIIPVHNDEEYVSQCIDSVRKQTLRDLSIICVDDGSTDQSRLVIQEKVKSDDRVVLLTQKNLGASAARNNGLKIVDSEYVLFLDADDFYDDDMALEKLYYYAKKEGAMICAAYMKYYINNRFRNAEYFRGLNIDNEEGGWIRFTDIQQDWGFTCYLYSVELIKKNKIEFPSYSIYEDPVFLLRCVSRTEKIYFVPVSLYCYRQGHHVKGYSDKSICDLVRGIRDNLQTSFELGYDKLYDLLIRRLDETYRDRIFDHLSIEVVGILTNIKRFDAEIGRDSKLNLLEDINYILKNRQKNDIDKSSTNINDISQIGATNNYIFPLHIFPKGARVIIYGSGELGESFFRQGKTYDVVDIVGIVDKDISKSDSSDITVENIKILSELSFDYVLLATMKKDKALEMRSDILKMGVKESSIIWDGGSYDIVGFYRNVYIPFMQKMIKYG